MKKKILITGAKGFFGTRFCKHYQEKYDVLGTDKDDTDITDQKAVAQLITNFKPDFIIHTAAIPVTNFCNENPAIAHKINVEGALNVARAAKSVGARMVLLSTEQIYNGNSEKGPYKETDIPVPDTVYGLNKVEAESKIKEYLDEFWVLRFTWLFGLPERGCNMNPNILWNAIQIALKGEPTQITDNEFRGYTYVYDVIDQFDQLFALPYDTYHVGSRNDLSRYDVTCHIFRELGLESRIDDLLVKTHGPYRDDRLDTGKIQSLGFHFDESIVALNKCIREFYYR
jgi:dTDP-4-dehydrorhamnose reductase